jgi:hypothetical protein
MGYGKYELKPNKGASQNLKDPKYSDILGNYNNPGPSTTGSHHAANFDTGPGAGGSGGLGSSAVAPTNNGPSDFEQGTGAILTGLGTLATTANPYLALGAAGLNLYQSFKNQDASDENYKNQMAAYRDSQNQAAETNKRNMEAQGVQNMYQDANYSGQIAKETYDPYKAYFSSVGR